MNTTYAVFTVFIIIVLCILVVGLITCTAPSAPTSHRKSLSAEQTLSDNRLRMLQPLKTFQALHLTSETTLTSSEPLSTDTLPYGWRACGDAEACEGGTYINRRPGEWLCCLPSENYCCWKQDSKEVSRWNVDPNERVIYVSRDISAGWTSVSVVDDQMQGRIYLIPYDDTQPTHALECVDRHPWDLFGYRVCLGGDYCFALGLNGIYQSALRLPSYTWSAPQLFIPRPFNTLPMWGWALAATRDGKWLFVGAPAEEGLVAVLYRPTWDVPFELQTPVLRCPSGAQYDQGFGFTLTVVESLLFVGCKSNNPRLRSWYAFQLPSLTLFASSESSTLEYTTPPTTPLRMYPCVSAKQVCQINIVDGAQKYTYTLQE